jgi:hypothetical protein
VADVFISYKSDRRGSAEHLSRMIELHGFSVWFDYFLLSGRDFGKQIEAELRTAKAVIVLWCPLSRESDWVLEEAGYANRQHKLIPVWLERVDQPLGFQRLDTIDLSAWDGSPAGGPGINRLLSEIGRLVGREAHIESDAALLRFEETWRRGGSCRFNAFPHIEPLKEQEKQRIKPPPEIDDFDRAPPRVDIVTSNIAIAMETIALKYQEFNIWLFSGVSGFTVDFASIVAGVHFVATDNGKLVGFLCAPNWTIMYVMLFPFYNFTFCQIVNRVNEILPKFLETGVIAAGKGGRLTDDTLMADWRKQVGSASAALWLLLVVVTFISLFQWQNDVFSRLINRTATGTAPDWSTISVVSKNAGVSVFSDIWFSALAYLYMAIALWIYTAVPIYSSMFAGYLANLSAKKGKFVLILQPEVFSQEISDLTRKVFTCTFLGVLATYLMSLQAAYLQAPEANILSYMFSGERSLLKLLIRSTAVGGAANNDVATFTVTSSFTCWPVAIYALGMLFFYLNLMQKAYVGAKENYINHLAANTASNPSAQIARLRDETFVDAVLPTYRHIIILTVGAVTCCFLPMFGSLIIGTLGYAAWRLFIVSKPKATGGLEHPLAT